jgi:hypothetical protein
MQLGDHPGVVLAEGPAAGIDSHIVSEVPAGDGGKLALPHPQAQPPTWQTVAQMAKHAQLTAGASAASTAVARPRTQVVGAAGSDGPTDAGARP